MCRTWNAQAFGSASSKDALADCAPLCRSLFLPAFLWASTLFSLLAGGCILAPPLDLWLDFEHPLHEVSGE